MKEHEQPEIVKDEDDHEIEPEIEPEIELIIEKENKNEIEDESTLIKKEINIAS